MSDIAESHSVSSSQPAKEVGLTDHDLSRISRYVSEEAPEPDIVGWFIRGFRGQVIRLAALGASLGLLLGILLYSIASPKFESQAVIRIAATQPFIMYEGNSMASRTFDAFVQAQVGMLSGPSLMEASAIAVQESNSGATITPIAFSRHIRVSESKSVIKIIANSDDPETAQQYANTLLDTYLDAQREQVRSRGDYRVTELSNREVTLAKRLDAKDDEILELGGEYGLDSAIVAHNNKLVTLQNSVRSIEKIERMIAELEAFGSASGGLIADDVLLKELVQDNALDDMLFAQSKRLAQLASLELRYQPSSRRIVEAKAAIEVLEEAMAARREQIKTLKMSGEVPVDAASREARIAELGEKLARTLPERKQLENEARALNSKIVRLRSLEKEASTLREILDETRRALDRVQLESRLDIPGAVELVARAPLPLEAAKDQRKILAIAGFIVGFGTIVGLFLLKLILQPTVRFSDDLDSFDHETPMVGQLKSNSQLSVDNAVDFNVYRLRNNIQLSDISPLARGRRAKVIGISTDSEATNSRDLAQNLGASFSTSGLATLVVDTWAGTATGQHPPGAEGGWYEFVSGSEPNVHSAPSGVQCMARGGNNGLTGEHLSLQQVRIALEKLNRQYDVIVVDVGKLTDNLSADFVVAQCDLILLATKPNSPAAQLRRAINHLKSLSPQRVRLVMTEMLQNDPKYTQA